MAQALPFRRPLDFSTFGEITGSLLESKKVKLAFDSQGNFYASGGMVVNKLRRAFNKSTLYNFRFLNAACAVLSAIGENAICATRAQNGCMIKCTRFAETRWRN